MLIMYSSNKYLQYLQAVARPFKKITKLDFLQPDNSVAFSLGNNFDRRITTANHNSRAFIQGGSLNVSTNNGQRRSANITLSNIDGAFDYSVNNLWFGQKLKLYMGLVLPDGTDFYLPQGVFYIKNPQNIFKPNGRQISLSLVDKWAMLDGSLGGRLPNTYIIENEKDEKGKIKKFQNVFDAISGLLKRSKYSLEKTSDISMMIDNVDAIFTDYYNNKTYDLKQGDGSISTESIIKTVKATDLPYDITENIGGTIGNLILSLNNTFVGMCGYNANGAFTVEPSQEDILDSQKPILWNFSPSNSQLLGITERVKNTEVFNDILITGESLNGGEVWGRAKNLDSSSDTNIKLIGVKTYVENKSEYWNAKQCADLAKWKLKRKTVLQKEVTIESRQMFHLIENNLVTIQRTDKEGAPTERHLINSFSIPIGETGSMTINATSVNDFPNATVTMFPARE